MVPVIIKRALNKMLPKRAVAALSVWYWRLRNAIPNSYEPECERLAKFVHPGDWVVDVGVNMGQYSSRLGRLAGPAGKVIGFEASKATHAQSQRIVGSRTVAVHHCAVGASDGEVVLGRYANEFGVTNHGISRVIPASDVAASERESVRCVTLDGFLADRQRPIAFIKCDVEGYEPQVFDGAKAVIAADRPVFLVEIQDPNNYRHVANLLAPYQYQTYQLDSSRQWKRVEGYDQRWTINFLFVPPSRSVD